MKGDAEAFAIEAKAKAEAEQMIKKAAAFKEYQETALVDMVLEMLPRVTSIFIFMFSLSWHLFSVVFPVICGWTISFSGVCIFSRWLLRLLLHWLRQGR